MDERLRQTVRERAGYRCEYCCLPQDAEPFFAYHVEHIVARQHGGGDDSGNLALACYHCNAHKGPNLSGLDPESGALVRLFHPRQDQWDEHFERNGVLFVGRTAVGRATVGFLFAVFDALVLAVTPNRGRCDDGEDAQGVTELLT